MWLPVPSGWWTSGAGPAPPLPGPGRSGHDITGPDITWISQKPRLDSKHWKLSDGSGPQPDWEIGHSRSRALWLTGPAVPWLRVCQATTLHCPAADSGSPVQWPWSVIYLRTWVTDEPPVSLLYRFGKFQTGSLDASWAEAKFGNTSLKFSKVLVRFIYPFWSLISKWHWAVKHQGFRHCSGVVVPREVGWCQLKFDSFNI